MPKKLVSIIMPAYNAKIYIKQAIECVINQTYQNWELIIVDDGSTDNTADIIGTFSDPRIHYFYQENRGEAVARNMGMGQMKGEYMAFLDSDDLYLPTALEDLSTFLNEHPEFDVVYSDGQICDEEGRPLMPLNDIRSGIHTGYILEQLVLSSSVITVPVCTMTRIAKISEHSIQFDSNLIIGPDWDFWIQLAVHVRFGYLNKMTCKYRIHNANVTKTVNARKRKQDLFSGRSKIMNANWFIDLSLYAQKLFFLDLLVNILTGNIEMQIVIMNNTQLMNLPSSVRSYFWRMVGIDALQAGHSLDKVKQCLQKSNLINPDDKKTSFLLRSLSFGRTFTLLWVGAWRWLLRFIEKFNSPNNSKAAYLQKLLEVQ